ncbi:extracellular solute-binding protein [Anaerolineales bacterium HSG25]|nr:extracellular solute-binding protein [Anaerolineales bacterium HSG25]
MLKLFSRILIITIVTTLLAACQNFIPIPGQDPDELRGTILIWHAWEDNEAQVLDEILDEFTDTHPNVTIIRRTLADDVIIEEFSRLAASGLGPDILIAPADQAGDLAQAGLIQNLQSYTIDPEAALDEGTVQSYKIDPSIYLAAAMDMLRDRDDFYGLPLSLNTTVLYYNKELLNQFSDKASPPEPEVVEVAEPEPESVAEGGDSEVVAEPVPTSEPEPTPEPIETVAKPAATLQELWEHVNQGHQIAFPISFHNSSWGIQAFGGNLFNEKGQVVLNQGGFANWLGWLKRLQDIPTVIFNTDHQVLTELFTDGRVTYYIGNTNELSALQAALGEEVVGTIRLPARQNKPAGPFLQAEVMMFNKASSPQDTELALRLARFLTNIDQQRELALETGELPVHKRVRIDPRVSLVVSEMIAQSRTSVPVTLDNISKLRDLEEAGDELYQQVLSGEVAGGGAATLLTQEINIKYGFEALPTAKEFACLTGSTIEVWHSWPSPESAVLDEIKNNYLNLCPDSSVRIVAVEADEFYSKYNEATLDKQGPDLIIGTNRMLPSLVANGSVKNIDDMMDPEFLQRYIPQVEQSMRYDGDLHGIPISLDLMGLYYNTDMVKDPPVVLDDLLVAASPETQVAFPIGFYESYWGISAFGESSDSPIFDEENRLILGEVGLSDWLAWLKVAKEEQGFVFSENLEELKTMFLDESAAYLMGEASLLSELQTNLGEDKIGVVPLPAGGPLLIVKSMMLNPNSDEEKSALALHFAQYVSSSENQMLLLEQANKIPANVNVNVTSLAIAGFVEQTNASVVIPNQTETVAVFEWGDTVYQQVLDGDIDSTRATQDFTTLVNLVNGFDVTSEETLAEYADCTDEGQVLLWHSWSGAEITAWQSIVDNFTELCPGIQLQTQHVPADELVDELLALIKAPTLTDTVETTATLGSALPAETSETLTPTVEVEVTESAEATETTESAEATEVTTATVTMPDFFMASHDLILPLLEAELLADLTPLMDETALINYVPKAAVAIQHQEKVYGIPQSLNTVALYYNKNLVEEPVSTLDELLRSATPTKQVALNPLFYESFWGASALGCEPCQNGQMFDEQGTIVVTSNDFSTWAKWLENAQDKSGFILSADSKELEERFVAGEVAYLIAGPHALSVLQNALGKANVGVTTLPEGETGAAKPFLRVETFLFSNESNEDQKALALKFAKFANLQKQQTLLLQEGNFIPTNKLTTAINDDASIDKFVTQVGSSILAPDVQNMELLETTSGITYTIVTTTTVTTTTNNN